MAITYSTNLKITLIGTGDQAGTWGNTTNTNLGTLIEQAIAGYVSQTVADSAVSPTSLTIADGTDSVARNMVLVLQGVLTAARDLILPTNKKLYFIHNNTSGGFAVTAKCSGQTGVSIPSGAKIILACNGTDIVEAFNYSGSFIFPSSATITTLSGTTLGYGSASITNASIASGTITNLKATTFSGGSASITTVTGASANFTTITGTSANFTTITGTSANLVTLTANTIGSTASSTIRGSSGVITQFSATSATITTLTATNASIAGLSLTSANITTLTGTVLGYGSASITTASVGSGTITNLLATTFSGGSASITTVTGTTIGTTGTSQIRGASGSITQFTATSATITTITSTSATITGLNTTSAVIGRFNAGSSSVDSLFASGVITVAGAAHTNPTALTFAASSLAVNCDLSNVFTVTMTANITAAPVLSNARDGQTINWFFTQDGTGSRTAIWPTSFKWPGGTTGVLSTASSSVDLLVATYRSATTAWYSTLSKDFS
tara:strand:- start:141 stop:1637 length:1497 start_codon:yes stop_codon:yes gene_type:complete